MPTPTFSFKSDWQQLAEALTALANTFVVNQGEMMSTIADLKQTVDAIDAKVDDLVVAWEHLKSHTNLDAGDQKMLDDAVSALQGEEAKVDVANSPAPPAPAP